MFTVLRSSCKLRRLVGTRPLLYTYRLIRGLNPLGRVRGRRGPREKRVRVDLRGYRTCLNSIVCRDQSCSVGNLEIASACSNTVPWTGDGVYDRVATTPHIRYSALFSGILFLVAPLFVFWTVFRNPSELGCGNTAPLASRVRNRDTLVLLGSPHKVVLPFSAAVSRGLLLHLV